MGCSGNATPVFSKPLSPACSPVRCLQGDSEAVWCQCKAALCNFWKAKGICFLRINQMKFYCDSDKAQREFQDASKVNRNAWDKILRSRLIWVGREKKEKTLCRRAEEVHCKQVFPFCTLSQGREKQFWFFFSPLTLFRSIFWGENFQSAFLPATLIAKVSFIALLSICR